MDHGFTIDKSHYDLSRGEGCSSADSGIYKRFIEARE
jgi:hypothetical protein